MKALNQIFANTRISRTDIYEKFGSLHFSLLTFVIYSTAYVHETDIGHITIICVVRCIRRLFALLGPLELWIRRSQKDERCYQGLQQPDYKRTMLRPVIWHCINRLFFQECISNRSVVELHIAYSRPFINALADYHGNC